jgi:hypothetical protein
MPQYVKFDKPPVVEVVCGIRFDAEGKLKVAHLGAFWATLKDPILLLKRPRRSCEGS